MMERPKTSPRSARFSRRRAILVAACAATFALAPSAARAKVTAARCDLHAVHLTKKGDGSIPPELSFIERELKDDQFAAYKGFHLIERKDLSVPLSQSANAAFRTGHRMALSLLGGDAKRLRLRAALSARSGDRLLVDTTYIIEDGGVFLMGGPGYNGGKLLFAIRCRGKRG